MRMETSGKNALLKSRHHRERTAELLVAAVALTGLCLQFATTSLERIPQLFSYYTIQTNLMVAALMLCRLLVKRADQRRLDIWTSSIAIWITVTGLGYHTLLASRYTPHGLSSVANMFIHTITPLGMLAFFLLISRPGGKSLFAWLSYPLIYVTGSLIRGAIDGFYPYWFLSPSEPYPKGIGSLTNILLLSVVFAGVYLLIGQLFWMIRSMLRRRFQS